MESFVGAPEMHLEAAQDGSLMGAPFMNQPLDVLPDVEKIIEDNKAQLPECFAFAEGHQQFYELLLEQADGFSIEPFYDKCIILSCK